MRTRPNIIIEVKTLENLLRYLAVHVPIEDNPGEEEKFLFCSKIMSSKQYIPWFDLYKTIMYVILWCQFV